MYNKIFFIGTSIKKISTILIISFSLINVYPMGCSKNPTDR